MTRTLRYLLLIVFTGLAGSVYAQEIAGTVVDEKKEPMISAAVQVFQGGILKGGVVTDYDGHYSVKPLEPGYYDVLVRYTGYDSMMVTSVIVSAGKSTTQNFQMELHKSTTLTTFVVRSYKKPLVQEGSGGSMVLTKEDLKVLPTTDIKDAVGLTPALYQSQRGKDVNIGGARTSGTLYVIDGVQVQGTAGVATSQGGVDQLEVMTSGIPAKYGDVSGGVVNITTRGVSAKYNGNLRVQQSVDGYNNKMGSFSISGPIYKKKIDSVNKKPVLGFALGGDYYDDRNRYPSYDKQWIMKDDVRDRVLANPLRLSSDANGNRTYNYASNFLTYDSLQQVKIVPNNATKEIRLNGKLDYQLTDNMRIAVGGNGNYTSNSLYDRQRSVLNYEGMPQSNTTTGRGFIRFTQKFGKANDTAKGIISNAYYSIQADYQKTHEIRQDANFKDNFFNYGYVGKFATQRAPIYNINSLDSALSVPKDQGGLGHDVRATILTGQRTTGITYERNDMNPTLANYTSSYYANQGDRLPTSFATIQNNAIMNGDQPRSVYSANGIGLMYGTGATMQYYRNYNSDQYALSVDASFDLMLGKTKHAIEFGLYYQQRIIRQFLMQSNLGGINGGTSSLWQQMRSLVATPENNNLRLDKANPWVLKNGVKTYSKQDLLDGKYILGPTDTLVYDYANVSGSTFDRKLREKLGKGMNDVINLDEVDPSKLSLNMFSADELLNISGNNFVEYYGYTYTGEAQTGTVNFNDFFTKKDKDGNFTRPIGAFAPNYIAGYILDKFDYKDMHFNIGLRVDRYSANTKVLKDPYSLYATRSVGQVSGAQNLLNGGKHPGNMGSDYVVYVSDNGAATPAVVGYRSGNNWYDAKGNYIEDPEVLKEATGGRSPQPYLQDSKKMTDSAYNPNSSFTDYTPAVNLQPRLQFSFPISDVANFYAHYDIYVQRPYPTGVGQATAWTYYELANKAPGSEIPNANIQPEKTFDYEVGFQQKLNDHSALNITGFYKERKNQISLLRYINAYPFGYMTYGNRDFSTTKGSTLLYDLRATNHLSMTVAYTLQFAEGTGSTYNGGKGLLNTFIAEGLPNLRYLTALDYDSRHNIVANIDYRYGDGEGPTIGGLKVLQNAGAHLVVRTRSGEPYTRYSDAVGKTVIGGVNGSRIPWHFNSDLRIDKDFALSFGKKNKDIPDGVKPKRPLYVKGILMVNNLFNTREIIKVYGYTGQPDDDGYLSSTFGRTAAPQQVSAASFRTFYGIYAQNYENLNYARTISLSLEFNF